MSDQPGPTRTDPGDALTDLVLPVFELNGEFLAAAEMMTRPVGLTPAWSRVLGAVLDEPLPVAEIARHVGLGLARQSVQRVADLLVEQGWARWEPNPAHRRAKLLTPTERGSTALDRLRTAQHAWADAVAAAVGTEELRRVREVLLQLSRASAAYRQRLDDSRGPAEPAVTASGPP